MADPTKLAPFDERFEIMTPLYQLNVDLDFDNEHVQLAMAEVRDFYFGHNGGTVNGSTFLDYAQLVSDCGYNYGVDRTVKIHANASTGNTYYYR